MPFIRLVNTHECELPSTRDDGRPLAIGDRWRCDEPAGGEPCLKVYEWFFDQRDGAYWGKVLNG